MRPLQSVGQKSENSHRNSPLYGTTRVRILWCRQKGIKMRIKGNRMRKKRSILSGIETDNNTEVDLKEKEVPESSFVRQCAA